MSRSSHDHGINRAKQNDFLTGASPYGVTADGHVNSYRFGASGHNRPNGDREDHQFHGQWHNHKHKGDDGDNGRHSGHGKNIVLGSPGNDTLHGTNHKDLIIGKAGDDTLLGRNGNDVLIGGAGDDIINGGRGKDTVVFSGTLADYSFVILIDGTVRVSDLRDSASDGIDRVYKVEYFKFADVTVKSQHLPQAASLTTNDQGGFDIQLNDASALDDSLGSPGIDTVYYGGAGTVVLPANIENVTLTGSSNSSVIGNDLNNTIIGNAGNNTLAGGAGDDLVVGGDGDDTLIGGQGEGDDIYDGSGGNDTVVYSSATQGITVDLAAGTASGPEIGNDQLINIENVIGGSGDDVISGNANINVLQGGGGNDFLQGRAGDDLLDGEAGIDFAIYTDATGPVTIDLATGTASGAGVGSDTLRSIEVIRGTDFADVYVATGFSGSSINAGSLGAFNVFEGRGGNDDITGNGDTFASYRNATGAVVANLALGTASGDASVGTDNFLGGVRGVFGSQFDDTLLGNNFGNQFRGDAGDDLINGGGGVDTARYSSLLDALNPATTGVMIDLATGTVVGDAAIGSDTLLSIESIWGTRYADIYDATGFSGSSTNAGSNGTFNQFEGFAGNDTIIGNGDTRIKFEFAADGVIVDLGAGTATGDASVGTDTFTGVNAVTGSDFADTIIDAGGSHTYVGGNGSDSFVFADSNGGDVIVDFLAGAGTDDVIDLTGVSSVHSFADVLSHATDNGTNTVIGFGGGNFIRLNDVSVGDLHADDFLVV